MNRCFTCVQVEFQSIDILSLFTRIGVIIIVQGSFEN